MGSLATDSPLLHESEEGGLKAAWAAALRKATSQRSRSVGASSSSWYRRPEATVTCAATDERAAGARV